MLLSMTTLPAGEFFVELFCGEAAATAAVILQQVPVLCPWDIRFGNRFDITSNGAVLLELIHMGYVAAVHMGTPCQSCTLARSPQVRSLEYPEGIPGLQGIDASLVEMGNRLIQWTFYIAWALYLNGAFFGIEPVAVFLADPPFGEGAVSAWRCDHHNLVDECSWRL